MKRLCQICNLPLYGKQRKYCNKCKHKVHLKQMNDNYKNNKDEWLSKDGKYIRDNQKCLGRVSGEDHWNYGKHLSNETKEKCRIAHLGKNNPMYGRIGENSPNYKYGKITLICQYCNNEYKVTLFRKNISKFCSRKCHSKWMKENQVGNKNFNWKGGFDATRPYLTPKNQCIKLNTKFIGSEGHHILSGVIVYIPKYIHRSNYHNMKSGKGMYEMNMLSLQYIKGEL